MSDANWTKGPWLRKGLFVYALTPYTGRKLTPSFPDEVNRWSFRIEAVGSDSAPKEEVEGVAQLCVAAPELYAALDLLVKDVADYEAWQRPCHTLDVAQAALAKAKGEQS